MNIEKIQLIAYCFIQILSLAKTQYGFKYEGDPCTLKNSDKGICQKTINCPPFISWSSNKANLRRWNTEYNQCGFEGNFHIICCPNTNNNNIPTESILISEIMKPSLAYVKKKTVRKCTRACTDYIQKRIPSMDRQILNGQKVQQGDFPHMAALIYIDNNKNTCRCGGTLISNRYVLTAAHCIIREKQVNLSFVRVGTINLVEKGLGFDYDIETYIIHPEYNSSRNYYDLALLKLSTDVEFIGDVHPACLNTDPNDSDENLIITGWGTTDIKKESLSNVLLRANLSSVSIAECNIAFTHRTDKKNVPFGIIENQMCAMDKIKESDTCQGDSGGPIQVQRKNEPNDYYIIYGVTSFGKTCGSTNPAVYTRVSSYLDWIESIVWPNEYQDLE